MNQADDAASPPPPPSTPKNGGGGGIMVFYPCVPDDLTPDPRTNQLIKRAISQAGAHLSRDSATPPSGFALMVPNYDAENSEAIEEDRASFYVDKASGGDGPWISTESKMTQWSPRIGDRGYYEGEEDQEYQDEYGPKFVDQTTEMSPETSTLGSSPFSLETKDQTTSTTPPPQLCHKFTSCSPTPSTTSTYPDSAYPDSTKSASCQDLVAEAGNAEAALAPREKRLSSVDTIPSSEEDLSSAAGDRRVR